MLLRLHEVIARETPDGTEIRVVRKLGRAKQFSPKYVLTEPRGSTGFNVELEQVLEHEGFKPNTK